MPTGSAASTARIALTPPKWEFDRAALRRMTRLAKLREGL